MEQSLPHSARFLPLPIRSALEQLLGRTLRDDETVSVRAYQPHEAPSPEGQRAIADGLRQYFDRIDQKTAAVPEADLDEVLDEAIRSVRPDYRPVR